MEPWYKVTTPRKEVREGRSFNPDEFAIALEQVVAGTAPEDYRDPAQFFARTCFTRALREHAGMVLRRLSGKTENTAPVLTLITQFGGGMLFGMADWDRAHFEQYAELYRPEAIVCWSRWARDFCRGNPDLVEILDDDGILLIGRIRGYGGRRSGVGQTSGPSLGVWSFRPSPRLPTAWWC